MSVVSKNRFISSYQAISLTPFGDIKTVDLRMNDAYIYETKRNKATILGKYPISSIVEIVVPIFGEHQVKLIFDSNQKLILYFPEG